MSAHHRSMSLLALSLALAIAGCASTPAPSSARLASVGPSAQYSQKQLDQTGRTTTSAALGQLDPDITIVH